MYLLICCENMTHCNERTIMKGTFVAGSTIGEIMSKIKNDV